MIVTPEENTANRMIARLSGREYFDFATERLYLVDGSVLQLVSMQNANGVTHVCRRCAYWEGRGGCPRDVNGETYCAGGLGELPSHYWVEENT